MTPIQRIKRLREHYPDMRLMVAKRIVDAGEDDAMVAEHEAERRVRDAAPELLEALEALVAAYGSPGTANGHTALLNALDRAETAIANARGER
jgi:hypothetical protein